MDNHPPIELAERAVAAAASTSQDNSHVASAALPTLFFSIASSLRASALFWFRFGLAVIPILPNTKQTAVKWDQWLKHLSVRQIVAHWNDYPNHQIGFIVGNGAVVFDADSPKAVAVLIEAECRLGVLPSMIVQTTRGEHHYYLKPQDLLCKTTGYVVGEGPGDRIDVKTGRTMVILPPSPGKVLVKFEVCMPEHVDQISATPVELLAHFGALVSSAAPEQVGSKQVAAPTARTMRLLEAGLKRLDADCEYETWLRLAAISFHVSGGSQEGFECFDAWSATGTKYKGDRDTRAKWKSFRLDHPRPLTMATLHHLLTEQGHDWEEVCVEADGDAFQVVEVEGQ